MRLPCRLALSFPIFLVLLAGCSKAAPTKGPKNPRVVATQPIVDTVIAAQDFTGRLEAVKTIDIRARVTGYVDEAPFKEGDMVEKDKVLFRIDPRPAQADVNQAQANLDLAKADLEYQEKVHTRAVKLFKDKAISVEEYDAALAAFKKAQATFDKTGAALDQAKLTLTFTKVIAPIKGRISRRYPGADPGNLVKADDTVLTTLVSEEALFVYFDVDERTYTSLLSDIPMSERTPDHLKGLPVMMAIAGEKEFDRVGTIDFIDNRISGTTGTVRMRGVFENKDGLLKPGLFARIRLPIGAPYKAIVIPDEAVQNDQERKYVWVVTPKNEVEYRSVTLGQSIRDLRVILPAEKGKEGKEGLSEGERIVVAGMQRVRKGVQVDVEMQKSPEPPRMSLVRLWLEHQASGKK
ncbi:MAG: efflux RND transporter periplasmic adaptor subunit [Gemmataceae bacterium]